MDHWIGYGLAEGRRGSMAFDPSYYLSMNQDVANAFGANNYVGAVLHWLNYGLNEGRKGSASFDPKYYLSTYQDVANAIGATNYVGAAIHWLAFGAKEGRNGSTELLPARVVLASSLVFSIFDANPNQSSATGLLDIGVVEPPTVSSQFIGNEISALRPNPFLPDVEISESMLLGTSAGPFAPLAI
jgi:hypothetical protein